MNSSQPKVFIVTPAFNHKDTVDQFLSSLSNQSYKNLTVIIVDDGSTDGTEDMIKQKYPETVVIRGTGSLWWSGSTNLGVKYALEHNADYVLTINNDVTVLDNYVESLVECAANHPQSLISSIIYYTSDRDKVWFFGAYYNRSRGEMQHITGRRGDFTEPTETVWMAGMGLLIPAKAFEKAGMFDEKNFPQYFGDADFSERAKRAGFKLIVNPASEVYGDMDSAWVYRQLKDPRLSFIPALFFSIRSPYQIRTRYLYYRRYWPKHYIWALFVLYFRQLLGLYIRYLQALGRKGISS